MPAKPTDPWRKRFDQALKQLQGCEAQARQTRETLAGALTRVSASVRDLDPNLEPLLLRLTAAARDMASNEQAVEQVEILSQKLLSAADERPPAVSSAPPEPSHGGLLQRLFTAGKPIPSANDETTQGPQLVDALGTLLDQLTLPEDLAPLAKTLHEELNSVPRPEQWPQLLCRVADLFTETRRHLEQQRRDFQTFLDSLTGRLQALDQDLSGANDEHSAHQEHERHLENAMQQEMREMAHSVGHTNNLDELRQAISQRLDSLRNHLGRRHQGQEQRNQQLQQRIHTLTDRIHSLESETLELHQRMEQARDQALHDPLTGIPNRLAYDERIALEIARWKRFDEGLALIICDVDHFKKVNDRYGHPAGDKALVLVARLLQETIRETDFLARYGGEEFVVLLPGTALPVAQQVGDKLRRRIEQAGFHFHRKQVRLTISCGVSDFRQGDDPGAPLERADQALYQAKEGGRNRCESG